MLYVVVTWSIIVECCKIVVMLSNIVMLYYSCNYNSMYCSVLLLCHASAANCEFIAHKRYCLGHNSQQLPMEMPIYSNNILLSSGNDLL